MVSQTQHYEIRKIKVRQNLHVKMWIASQECFGLNSNL